MATKKKDGGLSDECAYCSTAEGDMKKCTRCGLVCYCSKACQRAHWIAEPFGHRDRCVAPKDRKPSAIQPEEAEEAEDKLHRSKVAENDLCGVCFEPLLSENVFPQSEDVSEAPPSHAGTQTLVCNHSFHLKCASDLASSSSNPLCSLCRGPFFSMLPYTLGLDAQNALDVLQSMADKGQITWAAPPLTVKVRMRIILRKFLEAANRGDAWAQVGLGSMYYIGHCVRQDFKEALKWTQKAADQGLAEGQFDMGVYFDEGLSVKQNFKAAVRYYRQAAKKGLAKAQYNLGIMYRNGQGVKKDSKEAVKYYRQASNKGLAQAQINLGHCYEIGDGVKKNMQEAAKWYRQAGEQGHAGALRWLGRNP